jgi:enoyl-CoA hydratase
MGDIHVEALDRSTGIYRVTIDRKPVNALSLATYKEIRQAFETLSEEGQARCVILTGTGDRAFVSGSDVNEFAALSPANAPARARVVRAAFNAIRDCPVPVIGAINGAALGAGVALASACDILVASESATFGLPEINVGVLGGTRHLARLVPPMLMRRMALTGYRITAAQMQAYGTLSAVVPSDRLAETALQLAQEIAAKSEPAIRLQKETLNIIENLALKDGYQVEQMATGLLSGTPESKAAVERFFNKAPGPGDKRP